MNHIKEEIVIGLKEICEEAYAAEMQDRATFLKPEWEKEVEEMRKALAKTFHRAEKAIMDAKEGELEDTMDRILPLAMQAAVDAGSTPTRDALLTQKVRGWYDLSLALCAPAPQVEESDG